MFQDFFNIGQDLIIPELSAKLPDTGNRFTVLSIHEGGMGFCVHLMNKSTNEDFALKCIKPDLLGNNKVLNRFKDELNVWLFVSNCNCITEAIAVVKINDIPCVLARWMNGGDLSQKISSSHPGMPIFEVN